MKVPANLRMIISIKMLSDVCLSSVETTGHERPDDHAVEAADKGTLSQWTSPGRTADKSLPGKAQPAANNRTDKDAQDHHFDNLSNAATRSSKGGRSLMSWTSL